MKWMLVVMFLQQHGVSGSETIGFESEQLCEQAQTQLRVAYSSHVQAAVEAKQAEQLLKDHGMVMKCVQVIR